MKEYFKRDDEISYYFIGLQKILKKLISVPFESDLDYCIIGEDIKAMLIPVYELRQTTFEKISSPTLHTHLGLSAEKFKLEIS